MQPIGHYPSLNEKKLKQLSTIFLVVLFLSLNMAAQTHAPFDTLAQARALRTNGQLRQAEKLLDRWCADHPTDANAFWLRAQNEFWRKNFRKTSRYYHRAITLAPENLYLKLDLAAAQLDMGKFGQTEKWLLSLSKAEQQDPHFQYILAKKHFWSGDPTKAQRVATAAKNAGSEYALALLDEIKLARSPWAQAGVNYANDSQPLESYEPFLEAGLFRSKWLDLHVLAASQRFLLESLALPANRFELSNRFHFSSTRTVVGATAGVFQLKNQPAKVTGQVELEQPLPLGLKLRVAAAQKLYLHTVASLDTSLFTKQISGEMEWTEPHGIWAKSGVEATIFEDKNEVKTYWGWLMTPAWKVGPVSARVGYAYSFSDATESRFFSQKTLEEILNPWDSTAQIKGVYQPYFTPEKMKIHAALATLDCSFTKNISLSINGKYGFSAAAHNPYLYLDLDENEAIFIRREFQETEFTPLEVGAKLNIQFSEHLTFAADYAFTRNFFYEVHTAGARLKMIF